MAYIGNTLQNQNYVPAIDYFSGDGSTTAFTASRPIASVAQVQVTISNVPQNPGTAFTVSGNTITFTSAPPSDTNNIYVYYTSPNTQVVQPGQGTVGAAQIASGVLTPTAVSDQSNASTGYFSLPRGTTAQRPVTVDGGDSRYNSTTGQPEWYDQVTSAWKNYSDVYAGYTYQVESLVIAGGGGGDADHGGGGGAGGVLYTVSGVASGTAYTVTVGGGGAGGASHVNTNGANSVFGSYTAIGGGTGSLGNTLDGNPGGSGGGGGGNSNSVRTRGGAGVIGQGNGGGQGGYLTNEPGGGGGGAGAPGGASVYNPTTSASTAGGGGDGTYAFATWATATSSGADSGYFAGGGGGGIANAGLAGVGGRGGGGAGASATAASGFAGNANTGGGGGAGGNGATAAGGAGGSGIVIIRYLGSQRGTGGTVVTTGGYTYHKFTTSGTYTA